MIALADAWLLRLAVFLCAADAAPERDAGGGP
jgi:hypothetical protein